MRDAGCLGHQPNAPTPACYDDLGPTITIRQHQESAMQHRDVWLPVMRTTGLVTTETRNDLLVYDEEAKVLHNLNVMSREVWQSCDGSRTVMGIVACTGLDRDAVEAALEQLGDAGLLESPAESRHPSSQSRRRLLRKAGIASILAIVSVTIPMAKAAASDDVCAWVIGGDAGCINAGASGLHLVCAPTCQTCQESDPATTGWPYLCNGPAPSGCSSGCYPPT